VTGSPAPSLSEIASAGHMLATLEAVRDQIVADLVMCDSMRDKAALYLRLTDTLKTIDAIRPPDVKGDAVDEIAARRAARRPSPAAGAPRTKNSG
jgi:hypothetical protein